MLHTILLTKILSIRDTFRFGWAISLGKISKIPTQKVINTKGLS